MTRPYDAAVLTGGRGSRLSSRLAGRSKPELVVGGRRLLDRVLGAVEGADHVVVVGPAVVLPAGVRRIQEEPLGGGPVAGVEAALGVLDGAGIVVVLAGDLPFVTAEDIAALVAGCTSDGCIAVDDTGRDQLLLGAWRHSALAAGLRRLPSVHGASWRSLVDGLDIHRVSLPRPPGAPAPWWDCDTVEDLDRAEEFS